MSYDHKTIFNINSHNRESGTNSNFTYKLKINHDLIYDKVVLLDCSIPKSYYIIQNGLNTFTLQEDTDLAVITVTPGNYNRNSLRSMLIQLLNSESPNGWIYDITNNNINTAVDDGKFAYTVSGNSSQPIFIFTNFLYEQMGFNSNSTNVFVGNSLSSTNIINLNPESTLFLRSDICNNQQDNILQNIITVHNSTFSYIIFQNPNVEEYAKNFSQNKYNVYRFILTDEDGNEIHLNGLNIVFTIMLYKSNSVFNLIKRYLKFKSLNYLSQIE